MSLTFADSTQAHYAQQNADALRHMLAESDTRAESLMARYRLYPLTEDTDVIDDIPEELGPDASARELALLSGLWAYRAGETNFFMAMRYGRRSMSRLEEAEERDPDEPFVLLVKGQSLMFRPEIAGKDVAAAVDVFRALIESLDHHPDCGISRIEARSWLWLAMKENGQTREADELRTELLAENPPPLYDQFLADPPSV
ncbi:hypothetical protein [Longibacter salinarum]|uniref:hypothetical protein n=1 Tax=Longibacter salinarum TaxID=1850348 RepID=UPI001FE35317|nr:hypothetical protein [Longibacter salinarum]